MLRAVVVSMVLGACGSDPSPPPTSDTETNPLAEPIGLDDLASWTRHGEPVLRDPLEDVDYEVASDGHVFRDERGQLAMIYTGDENDRTAIRLALGSDWDRWTVDRTLLNGPATPGGPPLFWETAFYRRGDNGKHQIFAIGYPDESTYTAEIYLAEADALTGPWTVAPTPVVARGMQAGHDVYLMTSPSVVPHEGELFMTYLAWNDRPDAVTAVWVMGAVSMDDGHTWTDIREVKVPIGMEGQLTVGPDGRFYAVAMGAVGQTEGITLGVADHPFGPYASLEEPILVRAGPPYEVDEANAPQITFDHDTRTAYLYYVGANYAEGWWMMLAEASY